LLPPNRRSFAVGGGEWPLRGGVRDKKFEEE